MAIQYNLTHRNAVMTQLNSEIGANCALKVWTGSPPVNCAAADTGTLLLTFAGNASGFGTVLNGVLTANPINSAAATNTGTCGYFRIYPTAATPTNSVLQGTCSIVGGGGDMQFSNPSVTSGQYIQFTSLSITAYGA